MRCSIGIALPGWELPTYLPGQIRWMCAIDKGRRDSRLGALSSNRSGAGREQFCGTGVATVWLGPQVRESQEHFVENLRPADLHNHSVS